MLIEMDKVKVFVLKIDNEKLEHAPSRYMFKEAGMICHYRTARWLGLGAIRDRWMRCR